MLRVVFASAIIGAVIADPLTVCPWAVGRGLGRCVTNNPAIHHGSCYDPANVNGMVQCLPPAFFDEYRCPASYPIKCSFSRVLYNIKNVKSGLYLNVGGASTYNGANVQQWDYRGAVSQWILKPVGRPGTYTIENRYTGKVLNVRGSGTGNGANVQQWDNPHSASSQWILQPTSSRRGIPTYNIKNLNSGLYLNVAGGSLHSGANVQQYSWGGMSSQWSFETPPQTQLGAMSFASQGAMILALVGLVAGVVTALLVQRARRTVAEPPMLLG